MVEEGVTSNADKGEGVRLNIFWRCPLRLAPNQDIIAKNFLELSPFVENNELQ